MKKTQSAFTLLEILVVVSIIAILIALGTASFTTAQRKGRDARRKADVKVFQEGFEQYYSKYGAYPASTGAAESDLEIFPAGLPEDPRDDTTPYTVGIDASGYCVCATLENTAGNATSNAVSTTCAYGTGDYYCMSALQ